MIPDSYANGWRLECALCSCADGALARFTFAPREPIVPLHARQNGYEHIGGIQSSHPAVNEQKGCGACLLRQGGKKSYIKAYGIAAVRS